MDAIKILIRRAADKRDSAIKAARSEYRNAARLLAQLDESLGREVPVRKPRKGHQSIIGLVSATMPKDPAVYHRGGLRGDDSG